MMIQQAPEAEAMSRTVTDGGGGCKKSEGKVALVAGATGLVGRELVRSLLIRSNSEPSKSNGHGQHRPTSDSWKLVYGVARHVPDDGDDACDREGYRFVGCDLLDRGDALKKLGPLAGHVTHMFWVTWASQYPLDTPECCDQNRAMLANALDALLPGGWETSTLRHVALQTGTKHYVALEAVGGLGGGGYEEDSPRVGEVGGADVQVHNFYYALEDLVKERLSSRPINHMSMPTGWSVHRPGLLLGSSRRSHFNLMGSLCVYGSLCRRLGLPFRFCGLRSCWEESYLDASDARLVAGQHIWWASESESEPEPGGVAGSGQAFNAVNGIAFTWKEIWPALAAKFGLPQPPEEVARGAALAAETWVSEGMTYSALIGDHQEEMERAWEQMAEAEGLRPTRMAELANWAFLDLVFRFPGKMLASPAKARRLGFTTSYTALESVLYWVDRMRQDRLIP